MAQKINGRFISDGTINASHLSAGAQAGVLQSKLSACRRGVLGFAAAGVDDVVTTEVLAAANTDTPISALTAKGIYVGAITGQTDHKKVILRLAGTDNGVDDGSGDDAYAVLTENTGVYTLSYKTAAGGNFTMPSQSIDFYFVEVFDLDGKPVDADLIPGAVTGVVDAGTADVIGTHMNGGASKHDSSEIDYERADGSKKNIQATSDDVEAALTDLDDAIGALDTTPSNYTPVSPAVVASHLAAIDSALSAAGGTSFEDSTFEVKNTAAPTKIAKLDVSGVTAGQTRSIAVADRNVSLANIAQRKTEQLTLNATDITNKYKDLTFAGDVKTPSATALVPAGGPAQLYTTDFTVITDGTYVRRVNWNGLGLDGVVISGDILIVEYDVNG